MKDTRIPSTHTARCAPPAPVAAAPLGAAVPRALAAVILTALSAILLLSACSSRSTVHAEDRETALTEGSGLNVGPWFSPDGKLVAYTVRSKEKEMNAAVHVMPAEGGEARRLTEEGANENVVGWTQAGELIVQHHEGVDYMNAELRWVTPDGKVKRSRPFQNRSGFEAISPDGQRILWRTFTGASYDLGISDAEGNYELIAQTPTWESDATFGPEPGDVTLIRQSHFKAPLRELVIWSRDTGTFTPLPVPPAKNMNPKWSPDGRYLAYASDQGGNLDLWVFHRTSGRSIQITNTPEFETGPDWSPDGERLLFSRRIESSHVFLGNPLTRETRQLTADAGQDQFPVISPDGRWVAFVRQTAGTEGSGGSNLFCIASVEDGAVRQLSLDGLTLQEGWYVYVWSPDSRQLAFAADDGTGNVDIYRISREGGQPERVTIAPGQDAYPSWSPDGNLIAYMRFDEGATNIWVIPSAGGLAKQLTEEGLNQCIAWAPDSDHLAYCSTRGEEGEERDVWITSYRRPEEARRFLERDPANVIEAWSKNGDRLLIWRKGDDTWELYAYTLDGRSRFLVAEEGVEGYKNFYRFTEKGKQYVERIYPSGMHVFSDGENISNIYVMRMPELIEAKLQAGGDWN